MSIPTSLCFGDAPRWEDSGLPGPTTSYRYEVDAGLVRTKYEDGRTRQRRKYTFRPTTFNVEFEFSAAVLHTAGKFIDAYGADWFYLPLVTGMTGVSTLVDHLVRVISNPETIYVGFDLYQVTFQVESYYVDPECATQQSCDLVKACLLNAHVPPLAVTPPVEVDFGTLCSTWGGASYWGNPNG